MNCQWPNLAGALRHKRMETGHHHGHSEEHRHHGNACGCGEHSHFGPDFWTKEEKIAWLEGCLESLREEVEAVEERVAAIRGEE